MKYSLVIPCFNEAENILPLIDKLKNNILKKKKIEVILVNNGSTDNTLSILKDQEKKFSNIVIVNIKTNIGYGNGIISGLKKSTGNIVGWTHADLQTDPNDFLIGIDLFKKNKNIYVKGKRNNRIFFDNFFTFFMSIFETILFRKHLYDINAQPTIFTRDFFLKWKKPPDDFSLDLFSYVMAIDHNLEIRRFNVFFPERLFGESKWNTSFKSKLNFIIRTIKYSFQLKKKINDNN